MVNIEVVKKDLLSDVGVSLPIGVICSKNSFDELVNSFDEDILELNDDASIEDVKDFRKKLQESVLRKKIGIIHRLDSFSEAKQAVLLKIFENLDFNVRILFHIVYLPDYTIQTRSKIYCISDRNVQKEVDDMMNIMLEKMEQKAYTRQLHNFWMLFMKSHSLFYDGVINESEKDIIVNGLERALKG